jgi:hypothetical protein
LDAGEAAAHLSRDTRPVASDKESNSAVFDIAEESGGWQRILHR